MNLTIRPYRLEDAEAYVRIASQGQPIPLNLEAFLAQEGRRSPDEYFRRIMAEVEGQVVGFAAAFEFPYVPKGYLLARVAVDEAHRGQGYGRVLAAAIEQAIKAYCPKGVEVGVRDTEPAARAWAERLGFSLIFHRFESSLNLERFDSEAHAGAVAKALANGIRFFTVADDPSEETWSRVEELYRRLLMQTPDMAGTEPPGPDFFAKSVRENPTCPPEGILIAADGDRWVGMTYLLDSYPGSMYTNFTGTDPDYRGRGIAYAMKVLSAEYARREGARSMRTHNLSHNAAMLAVNERLGYERLPGIWVMRKAY